MKYKLFLFMFLFFISLSSISATNIYAGENYTFSVDTTNNLVWDVVNNHSNMNGFNIYQDIFNDYSNITFSTDVRFAPDSFTLIFIDNSTKEIIKEVYVYETHRQCGGSSKKKIIVEDETEECPDGLCPIEVVEEEIIILDEEEEEYNRNYLIGSIIIVILIFLTLRIKNYLKREDVEMS